MFKYTARVDRVNNILTGWDGKSELTPGQVLVQGTVQEYVANVNKYSKDKSPTYITVDVDGVPVIIDMNGDYLVYEGSPYEKLLNEMPEVGDVVQVLASYYPDAKQSPFDRKRMGALSASWCRSTYCLAPSAERVEKQEAFDMMIENMIDELERITDPAAFRQQYGNIITQSFVDQRGIVRDCRTAAQKERMTGIVDALFDEDSHMEKPLLAVSKDFPSIYSKFNDEFGIDLYSMSVSEAYDAVMEIAADPSKLDPKIVNTDYLFRTLEDALSPEQMSVLATTLITNYYPVTVRKDLSFKKGDYVPEPGIVPYNWSSSIECAIIQLSKTGLNTDVETLAALFETSVANDQFSHVRREEDFTPKIIDSLSYALCKAGSWDIDKDWYEVVDRERLQLFTENILPRLTTSMRLYTAKVSALPYVDGEKYATFSLSFATEHLVNMLKTADKLEALTK